MEDTVGNGGRAGPQFWAEKAERQKSGFFDKAVCCAEDGRFQRSGIKTAADPEIYRTSLWHKMAMKKSNRININIINIIIKNVNVNIDNIDYKRYDKTVKR